jgi:hypothetical protein
VGQQLGQSGKSEQDCDACDQDRCAYAKEDHSVPHIKIKRPSLVEGFVVLVWVSPRASGAAFST